MCGCLSGRAGQRVIARCEWWVLTRMVTGGCGLPCRGLTGALVGAVLVERFIRGRLFERFEGVRPGQPVLFQGRGRIHRRGRLLGWLTATHARSPRQAARPHSWTDPRMASRNLPI